MSWPFETCVAPSFDTGLVEVPTSLTVVSIATLYLMGAYFNNTTAAMITITVTNTAGVGLASALEVPAGMPLRLPIELFQPTVGLKWQASGAGLKGQMFGY